MNNELIKAIASSEIPRLILEQESDFEVPYIEELYKHVRESTDSILNLLGSINVSKKDIQNVDNLLGELRVTLELYNFYSGFYAALKYLFGGDEI